MKVLFDRRDPASALWPKRATFEQLLEILNSAELAGVWGEDETIGWVYQFFNAKEERRRCASQSRAIAGTAQQPRAGRPQPVLHASLRRPVPHRQHARAHLVRDARHQDSDSANVASTWCESPARSSRRARRRTRATFACSIRPAAVATFCSMRSTCCSTIYEEAYADPESPKSEATGATLAADYPSLDALRKAIPGLILAHNLHGVDIDPRCAQIAQLALWMRAQRAYRDLGIGRADRPQIRRSKIVIAEPSSPTTALWRTSSHV